MSIGSHRMLPTTYGCIPLWLLSCSITAVRGQSRSMGFTGVVSEVSDLSMVWCTSTRMGRWFWACPPIPQIRTL